MYGGKILEIANRIKDCRIKKGLKQSDFKMLCDLDQGAYSNIERGRNVPSILKFIDIAKVLDVDVGWLATGHYSFNLPQDKKDLFEDFEKLTLQDQQEVRGYIKYKLSNYIQEDEQKKA